MSTIPNPEIYSGVDSQADELPKYQKISLAYEVWKAANGKLSISKAARIYRVAKTTLYDQTKGAKLSKEESQSRQKLTIAKGA